MISKFPLTSFEIFFVKEKLARQIFLDKENLSTIPHLHEQFFLVKANLSRKNCSCKWGLSLKHLTQMSHSCVRDKTTFTLYFANAKGKLEERNTDVWGSGCGRRNYSPQVPIEVLSSPSIFPFCTYCTSSNHSRPSLPGWSCTLDSA